MIFVTVGHQMPFDRLVGVVDDWAGRRGREDVFAQIGSSSYRPRHIRFVTRLDPPAFERTIEQAVAIISHAGTGSIFAALRAEKPILVMPRRAGLRETRNDHQLATAGRLCPRLGVPVAADENELADWLDRLDQLAAPAPIGPCASEPLTAAIRDFIFAGDDGRWGTVRREPRERNSAPGPTDG